jgi:hypothetical protein
VSLPFQLLFPITGNTFSRPERQSKYQKEGAVGLSEVRKNIKSNFSMAQASYTLSENLQH